MSVSTLKTRITCLLGTAMMFGAGSAGAAYEFNLQEPATALASDIYDLHMLIFWICVVIAVVVFGAMFYSMYAHRKSRGAVPADFHENTKLEFLWTIVPFLILVAVAVPATKTLLEIEDTSAYDLTVKITGMQWKWKYEYVDDNDDAENVQFIASLDPAHNEARKMNSGKDVTQIDHYLLATDNELVLPVNKRVRFLLTSDDVIHAWWVPQFGVKKDAIPGYVNEMWTEIPEPGVYRGQCAELCGKDHAFMPIVVRAVSEDDYNQWLAQKQTEAAERAAEAESDKVWSQDELMARGEQVYQSTCAACHGPGGEGVGPFPALKGSAIATGPAPAHLDVVINGVPGTAMAAFGKQLNDLQIAAVVTYERNALGNETGDVVQPADVKAAR